MSKEQLTNYISNPKHDLTLEKTVNNTAFRPSGLLAWQEIQVADSLTKEKINAIRD